MAESPTLFEPVIGLEVHAELLTRSKMFCGCAVVDSTASQPNTSVCEICTGMPGTLPVINERAVEYALRVALALHCTIAELSVFARKNYFYPDLPKGYQISQYELPLARDGWTVIETESGEKRIRIRRVHLEEDTGKLFHRNGHSLIDYNRSGVPLLEIVSEPDMNSVEEVSAYATGLRSLLRYLNVNSGDMEKGVIRFEANVSARPVGSEELGTRTEIKNLNSFRALTRAIQYEIDRQTQRLVQGQPVEQETRGWDETRQLTAPQRIKETASDYRYFPEPDLPPLQVDPAWVARVQEGLPELAPAKRQRFEQQYGLTPYTAGVLTAERSVAEFFESAVASAPGTPPPRIANWLTGEFFGLLNQRDLDFDPDLVPPRDFAALVAMVEAEEISSASGKTVLAEMLSSGRSAAEIVADRGLAQINEPSEIARLVEGVIEENPDQVQQYLAGKRQISNWLFGQVMRATRGRGNPKLVRAALERSLADLESRTPPG